jgi:hypothetical protein
LDLKPTFANTDLSDSISTAEDAVDTLLTTIQILLESNTLIARRLASVEVGLGVTIEIPATPPKVAEPESPISSPGYFQRNTQVFILEEELSQSWVYKRSAVRTDDGEFSVMTSAGRTASWSMLSGLSLADNLSVIAVHALPIYEHDLSNSDLYRFGDFTHDNPLSGASPSKSHPSEKFTSLTKKAVQLWGTPRLAPIPVDTVGLEFPARIFGVPLRDSIKYAIVAISAVDEEGKPYVYGYVPLVVGRICRRIKEEGIFT